MLIEGGAITVSVSLAVLPVPPLVEETAPEVLFFVPAVVAVTLTLKVQEPPPIIEPPVRETEVAAATGVKVPPQVLVAPGVAATSVPAGKVSEKATPVSAIRVLGLLMVKVKVVTPPTAIGSGEKFLLMEGGEMTVRVSVAVLPVPPLVEEILPEVLVLIPAVVEVTTTVIVQVLFAAIVPPVRLMLFVLAVAVTVPAQVFVTPGVV